VPVRSAPPTVRPMPVEGRSAGTLPDPAWQEGVGACLGCSYSLHGLPTPGVCPECGTRYHATQLVLAGIPNRMSSTPVLRRLGWVAIITISMVVLFIWPLLAQISWWIPVSMVVSVVAGIVFMNKTGTRERYGTERFVITPDGIARVAMKADRVTGDLGSVFIPWARSDAVHLKRTGAFWKRLRIGRRAGKKLVDPIFDAGIRCPDAVAQEVARTIKGFLDLSRPSGTATATQEPRADEVMSAPRAS